ncbi:MAG: hypothetical protein AAGF24_12170 [Cyanobacteria bacterium P01_H01_bin.121]
MAEAQRGYAFVIDDEHFTRHEIRILGTVGDRYLVRWIEAAPGRPADSVSEFSCAAVVPYRRGRPPSHPPGYDRVKAWRSRNPGWQQSDQIRRYKREWAKDYYHLRKRGSGVSSGDRGAAALRNGHKTD